MNNKIEEIKNKLFKEFLAMLKVDKIYNYKWFMNYKRRQYKELTVAEIREVYNQVLEEIQ